MLRAVASVCSGDAPEARNMRVVMSSTPSSDKIELIRAPTPSAELSASDRASAHLTQTERGLARTVCFRPRIRSSDADRTYAGHGGAIDDDLLHVDHAVGSSPDRRRSHAASIGARRGRAPGAAEVLLGR